MDDRENIIERKSSFITGVWSERVLVITEDYEIKGYVFMPKTGRKNRILTDILNSNCFSFLLSRLCPNFNCFYSIEFGFYCND